MALEIAPNGILILAEGIPWDNEYQNLVTFEDSGTSTTLGYVRAHSVYEDNTYTFIRDEPGTPIRVRAPYSQLANVNYAAYQNNGFSNQIFYAFVREVRYLNAEVTAVYLELDFWQTWAPQLTIGECFVEREHVTDDSIGANTLDEGLEYGPYITTAKTTYDPGGLSVYIMASEPPETGAGDWAPPSYYGGTVTGGYIFYAGAIDSCAGKIKTQIDRFTESGKSDAVVAIFTLPNNFGTVLPNVSIRTHAVAPRTLTSTPRNNKLYCYPYCALGVQAGGTTEILRYENFTGSQILNIYSSFGPNSQSLIVPANYENMNIATNYSMSVSGWPLLGWVTNYFQNWLAQNKATLQTSMQVAEIDVGRSIIGSAVSGATVGAVGGPVGAIAGALSGALTATINGSVNLYEKALIQGAQVTKARIMPDRVAGNIDAPDTATIAGLNTVYTYCRAIKPEYLRVIDDFFTRFGYKVNRLKVPNINTHTKYNYVKTSVCSVGGSAPEYAQEALRKCLQRGVTFWHTPDVGTYSVQGVRANYHEGL